MRTLIVDDNTDNLYLLQALLRGNGYDVVRAMNGEEALVIARQTPPDIVISDILMPVMDGFSLCRTWKQDPVLRAIPFVFYTATYTEPKDEKLALNLGADLFLVKPTEPDLFLRMIGEVLAKYQAGQISGHAPAASSEDTYLKEYNQVLIHKLEKKLIELEEANRALTEKDTFNQAVINAVTAHVAVVDAKGRVIAVNEAWEGAAGRAEEPPVKRLHVGESLADLPPDSFVEGIQRVLAGEEDAYEAEYACQTPEAERWYLMRVAPFGGAPTRGAVVSCFEITERVRAERERHETEVRFQGLFNAVSDAILVYEVGEPWGVERLQEVNDAACQLLEYSRAELLAMPLEQLCACLGPEISTIWETLRTESSASCAHTLIAKNGQEISVDTQAYRCESIGRLGAFTVSRDTRAHKRAQRERQHLEEQLRQAQKMEAVGQLAGGVAHDFNNLLQAISGYSELAREAIAENSPALESLQQVQQAATRATTLVRQLLTFSRRETLHQTWLDLNLLIGDLAKIIMRLIGEHIELSFMPVASLPPLYADAGQIEQILINLCVNARDAMPQGGRLLIETECADLDEEYCRISAVAKPGPYIVLSVSDTGTGIPEAIRDRIFEPFFTTKPAGEGTGLGLATVYAITRRHEGFLSLYSEPGCGATFRIHLPVAAQNAPLQQRGPARDTSVLRGHGEWILFAEDDAQVRDLAVRILERADYRVLVADDGQKALDLFQRHRATIDAVVLDVIMPKMNGRQVCEAIHGLEPTTPILLASGYSVGMLESGYLPGNAYALIQKPYRQADLLTKLREAIERNSQSSPAR